MLRLLGRFVRRAETVSTGAGIIIASLIISGAILWAQMQRERMARCEALWDSLGRRQLIVAVDAITDLPWGNDKERYVDFGRFLQSFHGVTFRQCGEWHLMPDNSHNVR